MHEIAEKRELAEATCLMRVKAPEIAAARRPGQFVILRLDEEGERFPLTIVDSDADEGTITIIFQMVGRSTNRLGEMNVGDEVLNVVGPLGNPTHVDRFGHVVCIGGGVGTAVAYPITRAMKQAGNAITAVVSARTAGLLILEEEMAAVSDELLVATDDGSKGYRGFPTDLLEGMIEEGRDIDLVLAVGPVPMMAAVAEVTRPHGIRTVVSLNPIMVDGTGMCGGCRVTVGGRRRFACVDGPEFDAHEVDFKELAKRLATYTDYEKVR